MKNHFERPIQSDRNRDAFNGGILDNDLSRDVNQGPLWAWFVVPLAFLMLCAGIAL